jgi:hypothetical protein
MYAVFDRLRSAWISHQFLVLGVESVSMVGTGWTARLEVTYVDYSGLPSTTLSLSSTNARPAGAGLEGEGEWSLTARSASALPLVSPPLPRIDVAVGGESVKRTATRGRRDSAGSDVLLPLTTEVETARRSSRRRLDLNAFGNGAAPKVAAVAVVAKQLRYGGEERRRGAENVLVSPAAAAKSLALVGDLYT